MRVRNIEYWDNKEEHGIKYDWNAIMRTYRQLMRQAGYNDPLYDPSTIPWDNAKYFQLLSERAAGKTTNLILIGIGILLLVIGFICLATGPADNPVSLSVAPIILTIAYVVIIPLGILFSGKDENK